MDKQLSAAKIVEECYTTGNFEKLFPIIADNYEHHSFWVFEPMHGKQTVIPYYTGKGEAIRKAGKKIRSTIVRISDTPRSVPVDKLNVNGEVVHNARVSVWADFGKACVLMEQDIDGKVNRVLAIPTVNGEGMMTQLLITEPSLFNLMPLEE